ncbi:uncharacterized protein HMPREF1120_05293 [Exophiala dermatitidis NIH/UT8656]|uniref:Uncharacterized protein n=1 Tax=Exophiala dermatitidis (strain ATCC 34100 / CBS 525.76 / NIH/UT8656) TaxID=858893 RepID=H6C0K6_EXODN|nr:uncharacterized protein HMPREF1120_05293 [Exophiala dermatitidis NIH/UT8656]EHY57249.1 hypothetical protein HMPREF1120_05293 [Exophiala dermatitidis NIH/UT8656]
MRLISHSATKPAKSGQTRILPVLHSNTLQGCQFQCQSSESTLELVGCPAARPWLCPHVAVTELRTTDRATLCSFLSARKARWLNVKHTSRPPLVGQSNRNRKAGCENGGLVTAGKSLPPGMSVKRADSEPSARNQRLSHRQPAGIWALRP